MTAKKVIQKKVFDDQYEEFGEYVKFLNDFILLLLAIVGFLMLFIVCLLIVL